MFYSCHRRSARRLRRIWIAAAAACLVAGIGLAALVDVAVKRQAPGQPQRISAYLESSEWANTRTFWDNRRSGGGSSSYARPVEPPSAVGLGGIDPLKEAHGGSSAGGGRAGVYRTVCVRLCDGYYVPIKAATTSSTFEEDAAQCQSSCSAPARLFVYPTDNGSPEDMVDTTGRPYAKLPTAFLYRTRYDASCNCRAHPWEKPAVDRHKLYAAEAAAKRIRSTDQRRQALAALDPVRKEIELAEKAARKTAEVQAKDVLASLARIEASGLIHHAGSGGSSPRWSTPASWSRGDLPDGMMRLGGPRKASRASHRRNSRR